MDAYVGDTSGRTNGCGRSGHRRTGKLGDVDVHLRHLSAAHRHRDGMSTRIARLGPHRGMVVVVLRAGVVVPFGYRWMVVLVIGRPVVMVRMIVAEVLVYVERRRHGRCDDQSLSKHECDQAVHGISLLRPRAPPQNREAMGGAEMLRPHRVRKPGEYRQRRNRHQPYFSATTAATPASKRQVAAKWKAEKSGHVP